MEYSFTQREDGPTLGLHRAGRWDEVLRDREVLADDRRSATRSATACASGRARRSSPAYDQETHEGYLRHLVVREGRNTGQALVQLVTARGERFDRERLIEVLTEFPEVRSIHWSVNSGVAEVTNLPTELLWGEDAIEEEIGGLRFRVRPNAFLQTNTEMAEQLYAIAREFAGLTGRRDRLRPLLRHRHDRPLDGRERADGVGDRDQRGVGRLRDREPGAERDRQHRVLRRQRRRGAARPARRAPASPTWSSSTRRARGSPGKALKRLGEIGAPRVVYVSLQPDDARRRPEAARRRLRLPARARAAGRHVPAHAARRVRRAARARC